MTDLIRGCLFFFERVVVVGRGGGCKNSIYSQVSRHLISQIPLDLVNLLLKIHFQVPPCLPLTSSAGLVRVDSQTLPEINAGNTH